MVGGALSGFVVREDDAIAVRADEENGADGAESPGVDWELDPGAEGIFRGGGGGLKQPSEIDYEKSVRLQIVSDAGNRLASYP